VILEIEKALLRRMGVGPS
jgi:hypothetical protein